MKNKIKELEKRIRFATKTPRYKLDGMLFRLTKKNQQLANYKDVHKGKTVLVIGNGPSLNKTPLEEFSKNPSIGMNKINLIYSKTQWRPTYVICCNNHVVRQNRAYFSNASEEKILLAYKSRWFTDSKASNNISFFNSFPNLDFSKDFSLGCAMTPTVTYSALQFAFYTGAKRVILFGVDHNFRDTNNTSTYQKYEGEDLDHFSPDYFKDMLWGTPDLEKSELVYTKAKKAFEADGREIYDATIDGKLNVFTKIDLQTARSMIGDEA